MAIISFKHKFIFIKTTKTGGTSIEVDLSRYAGPDAIVTPIIPEVIGHEPRNFEDDDGNPLYFNHMPASKIQTLLGEEQFSDFYRFTVEREPIDKCLSHFHMLKNRDDRYGLPKAERDSLTWENYVERGEFPVDLPKYQDPYNPGALLVSEILPYQEMSNILPRRLEKCGLGGFRLLTRAKSKYRKTRHISHTDVTVEQRQKIFRVFAKTAALTGLYQTALD